MDDHDAKRVNRGSATAVLDVSGVQWATEKAVVETVLRRRPGVQTVEANAVAQTATVTYEPEQTSVAELAGWIRDCGYHCSGRSVPHHVCDPWAETQSGGDVDVRPAAPAAPAPRGEHRGAAQRADQAGHIAGHEAGSVSPHDMTSHGGHGDHGDHGGMSMAGMVADMRNRFLVAALLSIPVLLWSPIGREVIGFEVSAPFGLRDDVFS